jgi:hypothetical protein
VPEHSGSAAVEDDSPSLAGAEDAPQPGAAGALLPWALAAILVAPSAVWVARDRSVWSWDPASYATESLDLWFALVNAPARWFDRMRTVFPSKAPGTAWLGQLFVPLGRWAGSIELGLLASIVLVQLGALVLVFRAGRRMVPRSILPALVGTLFVASGPMFVALSHHYLTEALQLLAIAYLVWVAAASSSGPPLRMLLHLALACLLGVIAKFGTPAFVVFPAALAAVRIARRAVGVRPRLAFGRRELALAVALAVALVFGVAWYARNGKQVWAFAKLAASSEVALDYGRRGPVLSKLEYWLPAIARTLATPWVAALLVAAGAAGVASRALRTRRPGDAAGAGSGILAAAAAAQLLLVLVALVSSINEETRYLLALAPTLSLLVVWISDALRVRWIAAGLAVALGAQWAVVNARQLGLAGAPGRTYWERPPVAAAAAIEELARVERTTCRPADGGRWIMTGIDLDWLNYVTLTFYSSKAQLDRGYRCTYEYLGHAQKDPEEGYRRIRRIRAPFFVSLEERAMPKPPDFLNVAALAVLERVEQDPGFARVPLESRSGIVVFERVAPWDEAR